MNYRHIYHAGIFADIFKHSILSLLIGALLRKEGGFCYIDTHAGIGLYDLQSAASQKTQEYTTGLLPLLTEANYPKLIKPYLAAIAACNNEQSLTRTPRYYPGSPYIVSHFLRPQDRMLLNELHPEDAEQLKQQFRHRRQVGVHTLDAYQAIKALLPPKEKRGLVFIDPAYEMADEYERIMQGLKAGLARWQTGIYAVWYPIKDPAVTHRFLQQLSKYLAKPLLVAEMTIYSTNLKTSLNGCGILLINPPWKLEEELSILLPWLWRVLTPAGQGNYRVKFID